MTQLPSPAHPGVHVRPRGQAPEVDERILALERLDDETCRRQFLLVATCVLSSAGVENAPEKAHEVVQDAFLTALEAFRKNKTKIFPRDGCDPRVEFKGYVRNVALVWLRKNKPWPPARAREWEEALDDAELSDLANQYNRAIDFCKWMDTLSPDERLIVEMGAGLRTVPGRTEVEPRPRRKSEEIAKNLKTLYGTHLSAAAVRKRKSRLLKALRQWLEAY